MLTRANSLFSLLAVMLLGLIGALVAPSLASAADGGSTPINCTQGCYITTCNPTWCTVYHGASGASSIVGGYKNVSSTAQGAKPMPQLPSKPEASQSKADELAGGGGVAYVKFCSSDKRCDLVQLTSEGGITTIGSFNESDEESMIKGAEAQRTS